MSDPTTFPAVMNPQSLRFAAQPIEPLESRIAPAIIFVGNPAGDDTEYADSPFVNVKTKAADGDAISLVLGGATGGTDGVYYIKLNPGDRMAIFGGDNGGTGYTDYITGPSGSGLKGTVVAVFFDANGDHEVQAGELTGLSLGKNVKIQVSGSVFGDVVANYNDATGSIGGASEAGGAATDLLNNSISFFGASSVTGNIIAGGKIQSVNVTSNINQILTGSAANNVAYDFNGTAEDGGDVLAVVPGAGKAGPDITKIAVGDVTKIEAGGGGAGGKGGSISKVTLISDTNGWVIQAGAGGNGTKGGTGGSLSNIIANGLDANTTDSVANDVVQVLAGKGGDGTSGGGKGGTVKNVAIGYETGPGGGLQRSINSIADSVLVAGGAGGVGRTGGAGGGLTNVDIFASPTLSGNDLAILGGAGGDSVANSGKAGTGGSVKDFDIRNPGISAEAQQSRMFVDAGDGGLTTGFTSKGANGGSVDKGLFIGFSLGVTGGNGSQGTSGGAGGNVRSILAQDGFFGVQAKNVAVDAGGGGIGTAGKGGKGGLIDGLTITNPELSQFEINQTAGAGDGADSQNGAGGAGGNVSNLTVNDVNTIDSSEVTMRISAGDGGNGGSSPAGGSGGKGGSISGKNVLSGINAALLVNGGNGGSATNKGAGGAGGSVSSISFVGTGDVTVVTEGVPVAVPAGGSITGGTGGAGKLTGKGGVGGNLSTLNLSTDGDVALQAGNGGSGGTSGAAGKGGGISNGATLSAEGSTTVTAGAAGVDGSKAGAGGSLSQINVQAATTIKIRSGDGHQGGAGGSIKEIGVSDVSQLAGPASGLEIIAGNGSANGNVAGAGGSVTGVDGFIATTGDTLIQAGNGGDGATKASAGGSVGSITLRGGGGVGAVVNIEAGNAGDATSAKVGAKGGNVTDVGIGLNPFVPPTVPPADPPPPIDPFAVQDGTLIRHIAAGDGGDAGTGKGGAGGSIQNVRAYYDIGAMAGEVFGYNTMGGIFAGAGGAGSSEGASGSVVNISADSIASILAGHLNNGEAIETRNFASSVDGIVLNSSEAATVDINGTYKNYATAGVVGAIRDPLAVGVPYPQTGPDPGPHANTFDLAAGEFIEGPGAAADGVFGKGDLTNDKTDGFVAAIKYAKSTKNLTSVRPEAVLTTDDSGAFVFIDLNNTNGQTVIF